MSDLKLQHLLRDSAMILLGCAIFAAGVDCFLAPNGLAVGGITGLGTVVSALAERSGLRIPIGAFTMAVNAVLIALVARRGDRHYLVRTIAGALLSGLFIDLFEPILPVLGDGDLLLCALWGGVVCGAGLGIVMRGGGNTGGTDIIAQWIQRRFGVPVGNTFIVSDFLVIALSVPVFSMKNALYALVAIVVSGSVCDMVLDGPHSKRAAYIISTKHKEIIDAILHELDRGCTELAAKGGYSGQERPVVMCFLGRNETSHLKALVAEIDPNAIVVISEVHEIFGEGFKQIVE